MASVSDAESDSDKSAVAISFDQAVLLLNILSGIHSRITVIIIIRLNTLQRL